MTEVTFYEDFHCFEYYTPKGATQRFLYYLYSPVYTLPPVAHSSTTNLEFPSEKAVYSSDFLPSRCARFLEDFEETSLPGDE